MEQQIKELEKETRHLRNLIADLEFLVKRIDTDIRLIGRDIIEIKKEVDSIN